jgi:Lipopolysaccharide export system permease LptF/LptG
MAGFVTAPGRTLQRIARRLAPEGTYERILLPLIADLQFEHARARSNGERTLVRLRSLVAFWTVLARAAAWMAVVGPRADRMATLLVLRRVVAATSFLTGLLSIQCVWQLRGSPLLLPATPFALPAMLLVTLPVGALLAGLIGGPITTAHARATWRVAVAAGVVTFVLGAWVTPRANRAHFARVVEVVSENPSAFVGRADRNAPVPVARGHQEMTLAQLSERAAHIRSWGRVLEELPALQAEWHQRPSRGVACMAFVLLGSGLGALRCRRVWRVLGAVVVVVGFHCVIQAGDSLVETGRVDPVLAVWGPVAALALATLALRRAARVPAPVVS